MSNTPPPNRYDVWILIAAASAIALVITAATAIGDEGLAVIPRPAETDRETVWSAYLAQRVGGTAEYRLSDSSRVDIVDDHIAWEVEWCEKWEQSIGQATFYAASTGKSPGVWLLKKGAKDDEDYLRCLATICYLRTYGIAIEFRTEDVTHTSPDP